VLVIAVFYTANLAWGALGVAAFWVLLALAANRLGVRHPLPYALIGAALWMAVLQSGIHATVAGVLFAFVIPSRTAIDQHEFWRMAVRSSITLKKPRKQNPSTF
jgi:Na+:H+ antiporter, NhaA family